MPRRQKTLKTLNCPACGKGLHRFKAGTVTLDGCDGGCGGIWFDHRELARVHREHPDPDAQIADLSFDPKIRVHDDDVRQCPKCGITLEKKLHCLGSGVIMDVCPDCKGLWLDRGELEKIRETIHPRPVQPRAIRGAEVRGQRSGQNRQHISVHFDVMQQVQRLQVQARG